MYILGINAFHADSSACLLNDGELIAAIEEERIRRVKHWAGFPVEAIRYCLAEAKINIDKIDHIAISRDPRAHFKEKVIYALTQGFRLSSIKNRLTNQKKVSSIESLLKEAFPALKGELRGEIHQIEHHRSHLASSFFVSPYDKSALVSVDGFGDFVSTMTGVGYQNQMKIFDWVPFPHSLGIFYQAMTQFLGFWKYGDEYKVMGLAPYGVPRFVHELKKVIKLKSNGFFELNLDYFVHHRGGVSMTWNGGEPVIGSLYSPKLEQLMGPARKKEEEITQFHKDLASSIQMIYEECFFHLLNHLYKKVSFSAVCVSGGCAQNSVANGKIYQNTPFKEVYIPPAGYDAGTAVGSAIYVYHQLMGCPRHFVMDHAYWGPGYSKEEIEKTFGVKGEGLGEDIKKNLIEDENRLCDLTAQAIAEGKVIGWFQGKTEWGPRALGNRSILGDPRRKDMKEILNLKIKRRESFRPFAPSILKEKTDDFFELSHPVPFMEKVFQVKKEKKDHIPAVIHVDGSGRLQTVDQKTNPLYWKLIVAFETITGIPILLNTSFNENEPIVNHPQEALDCFLRTKMDVLVLGPYFIERIP